MPSPVRARRDQRPRDSLLVRFRARDWRSVFPGCRARGSPRGDHLPDQRILSRLCSTWVPPLISRRERRRLTADSVGGLRVRNRRRKVDERPTRLGAIPGNRPFVSFASLLSAAFNVTACLSLWCCCGGIMHGGKAAQRTRHDVIVAVKFEDRSVDGLPLPSSCGYKSRDELRRR